MNDTQQKPTKQFPAGEGITCPQCGCKHFYTVNTYPWNNGTKLRRRQCRHCKYIVETEEKVIL